MLCIALLGCCRAVCRLIGCVPAACVVLWWSIAYVLCLLSVPVCACVCGCVWFCMWWIHIYICVMHHHQSVTITHHRCYTKLARKSEQVLDPVTEQMFPVLYGRRVYWFYALSVQLTKENTHPPMHTHTPMHTHSNESRNAQAQAHRHRHTGTQAHRRTGTQAHRHGHIERIRRCVINVGAGIKVSWLTGWM